MTDAHDQVPHLDTYRSRAAKDATAAEENYQGLRVSALPGLHACVAEHVRRLTPQSGRVLDVAAGTGAFSKRLVDMGYQVRALEYVVENFALTPQVPCHAVDLNQDFASEVDAEHDTVVAIEIIEHLENPRAFLRGLRRLLAPGGRIVLTTPNVENSVSKAMLIRSGFYWWFDDACVESLGHITPIGPRLLRQACDDAELEVEVMTSFGNPYEKLRGWPTMQLFTRLIRWVGRESIEVDGEVLVAVLKAKE